MVNKALRSLKVRVAYDSFVPPDFLTHVGMHYEEPIVYSLWEALQKPIHVRITIAYLVQSSLGTRLQCGHSFCLECLQKYLENARVKYSEQAPRYHPIRASYIDALRCPRTNPESYLEAAQWVTDNPGPCYTCPLCEEVLSRSPIKDYRLKEMAESLQEHSGGTYDQDDRDGVENPGMFDRFLLL